MPTLLDTLIKLLNSDEIAKRLVPVAPFPSSEIRKAVQATFPREFERLANASWQVTLSRAVNDSRCRVRRMRPEHLYVVMDALTPEQARTLLGEVQFQRLLAALRDDSGNKWFLDLGTWEVFSTLDSERGEALFRGRPLVEITARSWERESHQAGLHLQGLALVRDIGGWKGLFRPHTSSAGGKRTGDGGGVNEGRGAVDLGRTPLENGGTQRIGLAGHTILALVRNAGLDANVGAAYTRVDGPVHGRVLSFNAVGPVREVHLRRYRIDHEYCDHISPEEAHRRKWAQTRGLILPRGKSTPKLIAAVQMALHGLVDAAVGRDVK